MKIKSYIRTLSGYQSGHHQGTHLRKLWGSGHPNRTPLQWQLHMEGGKRLTLKCGRGMKKASSINEAYDLCSIRSLGFPFSPPLRPMVEHVLCHLQTWRSGSKQEILCFPIHQQQPDIHLHNRNTCGCKLVTGFWYVEAWLLALTK